MKHVKMGKETLINAINASSARSAWERGVKEYAIDIINRVEGVNDFAKNNLHETLLAGARGWRQYSRGACALVVNQHIAARLCSPSEMRLTQNGMRKPNTSEDWFDVQARALLQAEILIKSLF